MKTKKKVGSCWLGVGRLYVSSIITKKTTIPDGTMENRKVVKFDREPNFIVHHYNSLKVRVV
jgi:hypothetical protein